jgi:hypothetical protein
MEVLPEAGMKEKKEKLNKIQRTPTERYPKVSYLRLEGTMEYTDQTTLIDHFG